MTPTSPPPPCYQQLSLSPRAPCWSLEDVRSAGGGGEERGGHGTKLQDKSFPLERGEEGNTKRKEKQISRRSSSAAASSVSPAFELLLLCCSSTPSATSTNAGARLRMPRTVSPHSSDRAGMRKRARSRAQQTQEAGPPPPLLQRQSKSIPIGEASHTMSENAEVHSRFDCEKLDSFFIFPQKKR